MAACGTLFAAAAVAAALAAGCGGKPQARRPRVPVTVAVVEQRAMPFALVSTGTVEPLQTVAVASQVGGVVVRVGFREGGEVRAGQVLLELDRRPFRAALEQALATLARDRAQAHAAQLEAGRADKLFDRNLLSDAERDAKRAAAGTWRGTVRADEAAVRSARLNLGYASIRAPIAGRTGRLQVQRGDLVRGGSGDVLVTINRTRPVRVRFTVPVSAVPLVQRYRDMYPRVVVQPSTADPTTYEGPLIFIDNAVDPGSGTLLLKGEFSNEDARLVPGEFVNVRLVLYVEPQAIVVPAVAVTTGQEGAFVYVLNRDSTVTARPVTVVRTLDEVAVLAAGLRPGETVITDGQLRLSPGAKVVVRSDAVGGPAGGSSAQ